MNSFPGWSRIEENEMALMLPPRNHAAREDLDVQHLALCAENMEYLPSLEDACVRAGTYLDETPAAMGVRSICVWGKNRDQLWLVETVRDSAPGEAKYFHYPLWNFATGEDPRKS